MLKSCLYFDSSFSLFCNLLVRARWSRKRGGCSPTSNDTVPVCKMHYRKEGWLNVWESTLKYPLTTQWWKANDAATSSSQLHSKYKHSTKQNNRLHQVLVNIQTWKFQRLRDNHSLGLINNIGDHCRVLTLVWLILLDVFLFVCSTYLSPVAMLEHHGAHELHLHCGSHFGQWHRLKRKH